MKNFYVAIITLFSCLSINAQIDYYVTPDAGAFFQAVNDSGLSITQGGFYDYLTETFTPAEDGVYSLADYNNVEDCAGAMPYTDSGESIVQPAYRKNGVWYPIGFFPGENPQDNSTSQGNAISENSVYMTGIHWNEIFRTFPFRYNTDTDTYVKIVDPTNELRNGAGYDVSDDGVVVGWVENEAINATGARLPFWYDGTIHYINPVSNGEGEAYSINANNQVAGHKDRRPFIYDIDTDTYTEFNVPNGYESAQFLAISDDGIAVGMAITLDESGFFPVVVYETIIYHPDLGNQPILLKDILIAQGYDINSADGRLGRATSISPNGEYIAGFHNPTATKGWILKLNDALFSESDCIIDCPENIEITLPVDESTAIVDYTTNISCDTSSPDGLEVVLVEGLPSGSEFPRGTTIVTHNLVDDLGNVIYVCSFEIHINDAYCDGMVEYVGSVEPISLVQFEDIDNTSITEVTFDTADALQYFVEMTAEIEQGTSYPITLEGNTNGDFTCHFSALIDWNQNLVFDAEEILDLGTLTNSDGTDGQQLIANIDVPADANIGKTRMRIVKYWYWEDLVITDPCAPVFNNGQVEDYTLDVMESLSVSEHDNINLSFYPNPVKNNLNISSNSIIDSVSIYSITGQLVLKQKTNQAQVNIDLSQINSGVYFAKVNSQNQTETLKVIKE